MNTPGDDTPIEAARLGNESKRRAEEAGLNLKPSSRMPALAAPELRRAVGAEAPISIEDAVFSCRDVSVFYGENQALKNVSIDLARKQVIAMIGPSGCGKSTFLRCLNRMNDAIAGARVTGLILLEGEDIHDKHQDVVQLRARVRSE